MRQVWEMLSEMLTEFLGIMVDLIKKTYCCLEKMFLFCTVPAHHTKQYCTAVWYGTEQVKIFCSVWSAVLWVWH